MFPSQSQILGISMTAFTLLVIILAIAFAVLSVVVYWRIFAIYPMQALKNPLGFRILLLSSEEIGWKDLRVRVYQKLLEEREGWTDEPTVPDTSLLVFACETISKDPSQGLNHQQMRRMIDFIQAHLGEEPYD